MPGIQPACVNSTFMAHLPSATCPIPCTSPIAMGGTVAAEGKHLAQPTCDQRGLGGSRGPQHSKERPPAKYSREMLGGLQSVNVCHSIKFEGMLREISYLKDVNTHQHFQEEIQFVKSKILTWKNVSHLCGAFTTHSNCFRPQ